MSKVKESTLSVAKKASKKVHVGQKIKDEHNKELTIIQIDETDNATYVEVIDTNDKTTYYGQKTFLGKFKL